MTNKTCAECGLPLILKPAGVSRATGKPYDPFMACSSGQRHKVSAPARQPQTNPLPQAPQAQPTQANKAMGEMLVMESNDALKASIDALKVSVDGLVTYLKNRQ